MMHIIAGKFKNRRLQTPKTEMVRPTTSQLRETLFNICQLKIEGARFLDLFAGSGAMGLEALSRGALQATFVEKNRFAQSAITKNISSLQVEEESLLLKMDVFRALPLLSKSGEEFDLIYVDPPYGENLSAAVLDFLDSYPLLAMEGSLFIEESKFIQAPLKRLKLKKERRVGRTHLYEYCFDSRNI